MHLVKRSFTKLADGLPFAGTADRDAGQTDLCRYFRAKWRQTAIVTRR